MPATSQDLEHKLKVDLTPDFLEVIDESAHHAGHAGAQEMQNTGSAQGTGGTHFRIKIAAPKFQGLTRVAKHRLVYACLQGFIDAGVHAIAIELVDTKV